MDKLKKLLGWLALIALALAVVVAGYFIVSVMLFGAWNHAVAPLLGLPAATGLLQPLTLALVFAFLCWLAGVCWRK